MSIYLRNFFRFLLIIAIQVLLLNKISLRWWGTPTSGAPPFTPYLYPLLLLLLPISTPTWVMLFCGFFTGLTIDAFMNTGGIHAAACVLLAFSRRSLLSLFLPSNLSEYSDLSPSVATMGWSPFLSYAAVLLLLHHVVFYLLEIWSFSSPGYLLIKVLATLVTSMVFVIIYSLLFTRSSKY